MNNGISLIAAERQRQVAAEGWTPEHDDHYAAGQLAAAAACYAAPVRVFAAEERVGRGYETYTQYRDLWPWLDYWWKPSPDDRVRELVKAGALVAAEIDRLQRAKAQP